MLDCILLLQGNQSETFKRLPRGVFSKKIAKAFSLRRPIQVLHLSPKILQSVLQQFVTMSETVEKINYYVSGLKAAQNSLGTVIQRFLFTFTELYAVFKQEINDLQLVALYQSGQVSKPQLALATEFGKSHADLSMTLMRLHDCLQNHVFKRVLILYDIIKNGIMDFLVSPDSENEGKILLGLEFYQQINQEPAEEVKTAKDFSEMIAPLDTEKIKPADRVSFLLNYLYLSLRNSQLLEPTASAELTMLRQLFVNSLDAYVQIMG